MFKWKPTTSDFVSEAFKMKVPVIYSSIKGISQVLDDCVSYIDPLDKENIAKKYDTGKST